MLNQCILTGNLGDDPSSHYKPEGLAIAHFNIAFKSSAKKKD
jgi:single-strand DNA-binding protein